MLHAGHFRCLLAIRLSTHDLQKAEVAKVELEHFGIKT